MENIMEVTEVKLAVLKSHPPKLAIHASGLVPTGGWSKPQLIPVETLIAPGDGIYDFNFVAERPTGIVPQHVSPIKADYVMEAFPETLKGVRVNASRNSKTEMLGTGERAEPNQYTFSDRAGRRIVFYPSAPGPIIKGERPGAELEYEGPEGKRTFRGADEVHVEHDVLGTLISATIRFNADGGGLDFALALPTVYLDGSKQQKFATIGTLVHTRGRVVNPAGADRTYEVIPLEGIAQHVMLPLAS